MVQILRERHGKPWMGNPDSFSDFNDYKTSHASFTLSQVTLEILSTTVGGENAIVDVVKATMEVLRFNLNVCGSHKFLKLNLNFNFYQKLNKTPRTPLQIDPRQKSARWYVETVYKTRRQKTCLSSSYLVIESSRKHYAYCNCVLEINN